MSHLYYDMVRSIRLLSRTLLSLLGTPEATMYFPLGTLDKSQFCCLTRLMHCSTLSGSSDDGSFDLDEIVAVN